MISKKKKVFTVIEADFSAKFFQAESRQLLHRFGNQIPLGGLFSFFYQKSASKAPKVCDFAYLTGQWGGLGPPPTPATLLKLALFNELSFSKQESQFSEKTIRTTFERKNQSNGTPIVLHLGAIKVWVIYNN